MDIQIKNQIREILDESSSVAREITTQLYSEKLTPDELLTIIKNVARLEDVLTDLHSVWNRQNNT